MLPSRTCLAEAQLAGGRSSKADCAPTLRCDAVAESACVSICCCCCCCWCSGCPVAVNAAKSAAATGSQVSSSHWQPSEQQLLATKSAAAEQMRWAWSAAAQPTQSAGIAIHAVQLQQTVPCTSRECRFPTNRVHAGRLGDLTWPPVRSKVDAMVAVTELCACRAAGRPHVANYFVCRRYGKWHSAVCMQGGWATSRGPLCAPRWTLL